MVRCFIGIMIPETVKENIENIKKELMKFPMDGKFVEKENLHICLSFLGEIEESDINNISTKLDQICKEFYKCDIKICGIKTIPSDSYIRVLALDVTNKDDLKKIQEKILKVIGGDAKPPHLTICRVKKIDNKKGILKDLERFKFMCFGEFTASTIQLIKSELHKTGPIYSVIHESKLL